MANYRRIATGDWTNLAHWEDDSGGSYVASISLPGPTDVVYANNFTVTLDVDIVVLELRTTTGTNVNAGGLFDFGAGSNITANVFAGTSHCVRNNTTNTKNVFGNITGGVTPFQYGVLNNSTGVVNITGNAIGGVNSVAIAITNNSTGIININGNVTAGAGLEAYGVYNFGVGSVVINGTSTGGSGSQSYGSRNAFGGTLIINGISIGGSGSQSVGSLNSSNGVLRVTTAQASTLNAGVWGQNSAGTTIIENIVWGPTGLGPTSGFVKFDNTASKSATVVLENNSTVTLLDPSSLSLPVESDVRDGVSYASGALTGTLVVPSDNTVTAGVVYDNGTTGTAQNTAASFLTELSTSPNLLAERLRNVSTVDSTAATIAAFKV